MPETRGAEFENLNRYRSYPFSDDSTMEDADGVVFPSDVFVDAVLYPLNTSGVLRMSLADFASGRVEVSDDNGVVMSGSMRAGSDRVELLQGWRRAGTLVTGPGFDREVGSMRVRSFDGTAVFSPNAVSPVSHSGVTSVVFADRGVDIAGIDLAFAGSGRVKARSAPRPDGDVDIWFDVTTPIAGRDSASGQAGATDDGAVRKVVVALRGKTLFRADPVSESSVYVWLENDPSVPYSMDRDDVCARSHLPDEVMKVRDTCGDEYRPCNPDEPLSVQDSSMEIRGCNVSIDTYDLMNYLNPLHVRPLSGESRSLVPALSGKTDAMEITDEVQKLAYIPSQHGYGIEISIPGVPNG